MNHLTMHVFKYVKAHIERHGEAPRTEQVCGDLGLTVEEYTEAVHEMPRVYLLRLLSREAVKKLRISLGLDELEPSERRYPALLSPRELGRLRRHFRGMRKNDPEDAA